MGVVTGVVEPPTIHATLQFPNLAGQASAMPGEGLWTRDFYLLQHAHRWKLWDVPHDAWARL